MVGKESFFLHPRQVALTLSWWHGLADGVKMLEHGRLTLGAKLRYLGQLFFDRRGKRVSFNKSLNSASLAAMRLHLSRQAGK